MGSNSTDLLLISLTMAKEGSPCTSTGVPYVVAMSAATTCLETRQATHLFRSAVRPRAITAEGKKAADFLPDDGSLTEQEIGDGKLFIEAISDLQAAVDSNLRRPKKSFSVVVCDAEQANKWIEANAFDIGVSVPALLNSACLSDMRTIVKQAVNATDDLATIQDAAEVLGVPLNGSDVQVGVTGYPECELLVKVGVEAFSRGATFLPAILPPLAEPKPVAAATATADSNNAPMPTAVQPLNTNFIKLTGIPFTARQSEISQFLCLPLAEEDVIILRRAEGLPSGDCLVRLGKEEDAPTAQSKSGLNMGTRVVFVKPSSAEEFQREQQKQKDFIPMDLVLKLRGLPFEATLNDIREFLGGVTIADDGIMIEKLGGRPSGQAFVTVADLDSAEMALQKNKCRMGSRQRYVEVYRATPAEMSKASAHTNASGSANSGSNSSRPYGDYWVKLKGIPFSADEYEVAEFVREQNVEIRSTKVHKGEALFEVNSYDDQMLCRNLHMKYMGSRYVEVSFPTKEEALMMINPFARNTSGGSHSRGGGFGFRDQRMGGGPGFGGGRGGGGYPGGYNHHGGGSYGGNSGYFNSGPQFQQPYGQQGGMGMHDPYGGQHQMGGGYMQHQQPPPMGGYQGQGGMSSGGSYRSGSSMVNMRGLPWSCNERDILEFFRGFDVRPDSVMIERNREGRMTGGASVEFNSEDEARRAVQSLNMTNLGHRYVELFHEGR